MIHDFFRTAAAITIMLALTGAAAAEGSHEWTYEPRASQSVRAVPPLPTDKDVHLLLDDDSSEGEFGVGVPFASQFMWFNRFTPGTGPMWLDEVWVLFPPGPNMAIGNEVEILVYVDADGDPTNGADLVASFDETIQAVDGNTFSVYSVGQPIYIQRPTDILVGVVSRFVESGVTTTTRPAALDTDASQSRSWIALWTDDPPSPPVLPPDSLLTTIDAFQSGNWMIRAFGRQNLSAGVPAQSRVGLALLVFLVAASGVALVARMRS